MIYYLSGKITGDENFRKKFKDAERRLRKQLKKEDVILNPIILPAGLSWEEYMALCLPMVDVCDCIVLLKDWQDSAGAKLEHKRALNHSKIIIKEYEVNNNESKNIK